MPVTRRIVNLADRLLGPSLGPRGSSRPLALCLLALLGACAYVSPSPGRGSAPSAPVPEVILRHPWMADTRWPSGGPPPERDVLAMARDVEDLLEGDFDVYPVAARRLIQRGEIALPCLGQAAQRNPAPAVRKERLSIALRPILRGVPEEGLLVALASPYPVVRAAAAAAVGERNVDSLGHRLVALLEDKDIRVRRASITSLRMLTGEFLAYRPDDPPSARAEAADRWDELWQRGH